MQLPQASRATLLSALLVLGACGGGGGGSLEAEDVTLMRDAWGVPHVFAGTDRGAYFGLGWATAQDRLFQMHRSRLMAQGRTAEFFGPGFVVGQGETFVDHDRKARLEGWWRHAVEVTSRLAPETLALLRAYADGVNAYVKSPGAVIHPLFAQYGIPVDPWRPEDCIAVWLRFGRHFADDGGNEILRLREWETLLAALPFNQAYNEMISKTVCNDAAAVVQPHHVSPAARQAMQDYADGLGLTGSGHCPLPLPSPKFSQAWALAGTRSTTGGAVLVGDPRITVAAPSELYEFSLAGASFAVRGAGVPGSPNVLSGSNASLAWSPTALGTDQSDLFELDTDPFLHPGEYRLDGKWRPYEVDELELIRVAGAADRQVRYRETVFGPVVTAALPGVLPGEEFAVKRTLTAEPERAPTAAFPWLYRATDLDSFFAALSGWSWPPVNLVFADSAGRIGYSVVGDVPIRNPAVTLAGVIPHDGSTVASDWLDRLPWGLQPHVLDPIEGTVMSANHMPVGSWYPIPIRFGSGGAGDTHRSRRLRERIAALPPLAAPFEVYAMRHDIVHASRRDLVELGLFLRDRQTGPALSPAAVSALTELEPWWHAGAAMDDSLPGSTVAWFLDLVFRENQAAPSLIDTYGVGPNGLNLFLATKIADVRARPPVPLTAEEAAFVDSSLAGAIGEATQLGPPAVWQAWLRTNVLTFTVPAWSSLEGLPSPTPGAGVLVGPMRCADPQTLLSPSQQAHTLLAEPGTGDTAYSLTPPGQSEHPGHHELNQIGLWETESVKPSPLSQAGVSAMGPTTVTPLTYRN